MRKSSQYTTHAAGDVKMKEPILKMPKTLSRNNVTYIR